MRAFPCAVVMLLLAVPPAAADNAVHGRLQIQDIATSSPANSVAASFGAQSTNDVLGDLRLIWEPRWDHWSFAAHYLVSADWGGAARFAHRVGFALFRSGAVAASSWWNFTDDIIDQNHLQASQRIDRLSISYAEANFVLRIGRQALSWGSGLVFRPMDLFDPFAPGATDTEYKPGIDMFYGQWLFADGSDLQFLVVPRRALNGNAYAGGQSSFAMHWHGAVGALQVTLLAAKDYDDTVLGAGINGPLGGATWNVEIIPTVERGGTIRTSLLANLSDSVTLSGRPLTYFAEYFHNGFGVARRIALDMLPADLATRLARGQAFDTGRDYVALGGTLEQTPLFDIAPALIANLNDASLYAFAQASYSLADDVTLIFGCQVPFGPRGHEFGGLETTAGSDVFASPPRRLYVQLRRYF